MRFSGLYPLPLQSPDLGLVSKSSLDDYREKKVGSNRKNSAVRKRTGFASSHKVLRMTPALSAAEGVSTIASCSFWVAIMSINFMSSIKHKGLTILPSEAPHSLTQARKATGRSGLRLTFLRSACTNCLEQKLGFKYGSQNN